MKFLNVVIIFTASIWLSSAQAVLLIKDSNGQLTGAKDVNINNILYDVSFVDGTCIDLFNGCDHTSDFDFFTFNGARDAGNALLDQVFVNTSSGAFDDDPTLTSGCTDPLTCFVVTPFRYDATIPTRFTAVLAQNHSQTSQGTDIVTQSSSLRAFNGPLHIFAQWTRTSPPTNVPVPGSALLLVSGLLGLLMFRRGLSQ